MSMLKGRINSFQSLGTVDGPGLRFVVFMQGCPLRCGCCHNPDTWQALGEEYTAEEVISKVNRFKDYFGTDGGITVSGGEPLVQSKFVREVFSLAKQNNINTCLDTSGCLLSEEVSELIKVTDLVLLDIKYTEKELYEKYVGCEYDTVLSFLKELDKQKTPTILRQVIIPTLNDNEKSVLELKKLLNTYQCVQKIELLPFRKICKVKYDNLQIKFPFEDIDEPTKEVMSKLNKILEV